MSYHRLLLRQLRRHLGSGGQERELQPLLDAISQAYHQADQERELLGRSLDLSSRELVERFEASQDQLKQLERSQSQLEYSLSLLNATLDATAEGMLVVDSAGRLRQQNRQLRDVFALDVPLHAELDAQQLARALIRRTLQPRQTMRQLRSLITSNDDRRQTQLIMADGRRLSVFTQPHQLGGTTIGRVWCFRDVTEQHQQEQLIRHQAEHDSLTGLPNRGLFHERLESAIRRAGQRDGVLAVLFIDLDNFKLVNDSAGHQIGDGLLRQVAKELQTSLRSNDVLARVGGDEFLLLLDELSGPAQGDVIAERIVQRLRQPMLIEDRRIWVHASIGVAVFPRDGLNGEELISRADLAMYHAKAQGRNNAQRFAPVLERQMRKQVDLHGQLQEALARDEMRMVLQPKVLLADGAMQSVEALLRWRNREGEWISPSDFIPAAERCGLIKPIGDWILQQALEWLCRPDVPESVSIAVNLSAWQLQDHSLIDRISEWLRQRGLPGERLELEVTESMLMENRETAVDFLRRLRLLGIRVAIDDFGTGYSSLNYLRWLPVDVLKIDRSFIQDLAAAEDARAIVRSIINLADNLRFELVAEGIEDQLTASILLEMGCSLGQGYLFSPPLSVDQLAEWMQSGRGRAQHLPAFEPS